ncbi:3-hydroxyisobutyrate dehydrogenase [Terribacillus saccharophilus]|uniref:3-hydroxyisobutyrate dehydrogenase n=1 Tax=Terribacillus saccharophilus TaxID=361277 RepID=A0AAX2E9M9_9BACI|nr:3-hydroxyisobutyrate dehydrogenase [Terribacillus saccharophilus]
MKLGFVGFGEAAYEMATGLHSEGIEKIYAFDALLDEPKLSDRIRERASKANVELVGSAEEVMQICTIVIAAVPANKTLEVAQSLTDSFKENLVYVDVSAATPEIKKQVARVVEDEGSLFVDAAMLGPLPVYKHKVPISASGNGTDLFINNLAGHGMQITKISDHPGDASALKLIRSIYMKGIVGLMVEFLEAAKTYGVEEQAIRSIDETMNAKTFVETMNRLVTGSALHAKRRAVELGGSIEMLQESNLDASISIAAQKKLERLAELDIPEKYKGRKPDTWEEVLALLMDKNEVYNT